jgi:hypothetical protein
MRNNLNRSSVIHTNRGNAVRNLAPESRGGIIVKAIVGQMKRTRKIDWAMRWLPRLRSALISVVMVCLVVSLATRTFRHTSHHGVIVRSNAAQAMRQHMNRDAARFVPPVPIFIGFQAVTIHLYLQPATLRRTVLLLDENLYNRPPPSC